MEGAWKMDNCNIHDESALVEMEMDKIEASRETRQGLGRTCTDGELLAPLMRAGQQPR
jgi:hypothetical protein